MRCCCALIAGWLVGHAIHATEARADDQAPAPDVPEPGPTSPPEPVRPPAPIDPPAPTGTPGPAAPGDPRETFGLRRRSPPGEPAGDLRETFGLGPAPRAAAPGSCDDGLAFHCARASDPLDDATPYALATWLPASYLLRLPVGAATHERVASFALGASPGGLGPALGGATGLEHRWTIDGAPADDVRTGGSDTRIPLTFLDGLWVSAGGFSARDRASTGGAIDARLRRGTQDHELTTDAWTELALAPRTAPAGDYAVRRLSVDARPEVTASVVATGPVRAGERLGGTAWYAAGIAPSVAATGVTWRAARHVDADGDGVPDRTGGQLALAPIDTSSERTLDGFVPAMARLGLDRGAQHVDLTLLGTWLGDTRFAGNATQQAAGVDRRALTGDAIATWRGGWPSTRARVQLAWHRSTRRDTAHDDAASGIPQLLSEYIPANVAEDPGLAAGCADEPDALIVGCPVASVFASGGAGLLIHSVADRPSATAEIAHRRAGHVVRAGSTIEYSRLETTSAFTGGELDSSAFPGQLSRRGFYQGACSDAIDEPCDYAASSRLSYRTLYAAAYAEATLAATPGLSIDAGVRWELMWIGEALRFSNQLAPRLGVVWDALGGGRSRLWASWGRAFAMLPAGLGATVIRRDATVDDIELGGLALRIHDPGQPHPVVRGIEPIVQDEVTAGATVALVGALRATLWGQARYLRDGLETTPDGFTNPGTAGRDAPEATREAELVAFALEMRRQDAMAIRAGVLWGRSVGTWVGPDEPGIGATLLQGGDWDRPTSNLYGALPTDPGGQLFVEAERSVRIGPAQVAVATRLTVGSGRPRDVLVEVDGVIAPLLPRGAAGRNPVIAQANLRLAARLAGLTATLDIANVFDRRDPTQVDEIYARGAAPIEGGSYEDLVFLKDAGGGAAHRAPAFHLPTAFQPPLSIALGVHKAF